MIFRTKKNKNEIVEIDPDEIFLDVKNSPSFDVHKLEGKIEKPISHKTIFLINGAISLVFLVLVGFAAFLQFWRGEALAKIGEENRLRHAPLYAKRGVIFDRHGTPLAWNELNEANEHFAERAYIDLSGMAHVLGYVSYPKKDQAGFYWQDDYSGMSGVEKIYDKFLKGENGVVIVETNALNQVTSRQTIVPPKNGENLTLSIDAKISQALYQALKETAEKGKFSGGAGVVFEVNTGEVLALSSYPEYSPKNLTEGGEGAQKFLTDKNSPLLNRAISGLYAPGSIVKPFMALAALEEGIIGPEEKIVSTGSIEIENPYDKTKKSIFKDWRAHGAVNMIEALGVSSDVYFYVVGGGYKNRKGLGISKIEHWAKLFGLAQKTGIDLPGEEDGTIPNPEWKKVTFDNDPWRIGNTYHTAIGQYGYQVTPIQMGRAAGIIARNGASITPTILAATSTNQDFFTWRSLINTIPQKNDEERAQAREKIAIDHYQIIEDGMIHAVSAGTAKGLSMGIPMAVKTGTAELGTTKNLVNGWVIGYLPTDQPKYAFAFVLERGEQKLQVGGVYAARRFFELARDISPDWFKNQPKNPSAI